MTSPEYIAEYAKRSVQPGASIRNAEFMNDEVPGASVPPEIMERMRRTTTKEEASPKA